MPTKYRSLALLFICWIFAPIHASGQWIDFQDETTTRLSLTTVPLNDDREKDIAVSDLDKDGWTDVVIVRKEPFSTPGPFADVLLMNENGTLTDRTADFAAAFLTTPTDARDVYIGDFDGDTWDDVVIANTFGQQPKFYRNLGNDGSGNWLGLADESSARFPFLTINPLQFCALWAGDIDGNGAPDLYFSNYNSFGTAFDVLLINDGTGHFTDESVARLGDLRNSAFGTSVEIHDMDNDGDQDIVKTSTLNSTPPWNQIGSFILFNGGTGHFANWQKVPSSAPYMFTVGDLNDSGMLDVYVVDDGQDYVDLATGIVPDSQVSYTQTTINGSPRTTSFGGNAKLADLDNDGDLDLAIADVDVDIPTCNSGASDRKFTMLRNEGLNSGTLTDPWGATDNPWNESAFDIGILDIDNDGNLDFIAGVCEGYMVFRQTTGGAAAVTISLTPESNNIIIGAGGGSFQYDLSISNNTAASQDIDIWITIDGPGVSRIVGPVSRTVPPGGGLARTFVQKIPAGAPAGTYSLTGSVGTYPVADQSDSFPFEKSSGVAPAKVRNWQSDFTRSLSASKARLTVAVETMKQSASTPVVFSLEPNYPNPFRAATTISYALPDAGPVSLRVFNLLGQEVSTLVDGYRVAGRYQATFTAPNLGAGLYFFVLEAGSFKATRQMVRVR